MHQYSCFVRDLSSKVFTSRENYPKPNSDYWEAVIRRRLDLGPTACCPAVLAARLRSAGKCVSGINRLSGSQFVRAIPSRRRRLPPGRGRPQPSSLPLAAPKQDDPLEDGRQLNRIRDNSYNVISAHNSKRPQEALTRQTGRNAGYAETRITKK
jgi:hypothetical protein